MSMQRKTITITDQMESWVKAQVDSGNLAMTANTLEILFAEIRKGGKQNQNLGLCSMKQNLVL